MKYPSRRSILTIIAFITAITTLGIGGREVWQNVGKADLTTPVDETHALVRRVVDGDTFELSDGATVRLIGVNTPESVDPRKPVEYYGKEASDYTRNLLEKRYVTLTKDVSETDTYGRLLRYVYLGDGTFINEKLVRDGYAQVMTMPPDVKYASLFVEAQKDAQGAKRGMWK